MQFTKIEIISFFKLYSMAKRRCDEIEYLLYGNPDNKDYNERFSFYSYIVKTVDTWMENLELDEKEIMALRFKENLTFNDIVIRLNYASHSSVMYKYETILDKIMRGGNT